MAITKPLIINKDELDWDTLELLEDVQALFKAEQAPRVRDLKRLVAGLFHDWTLEDAGKITNAEAKQIFESIGEQLSVPKSSEADSSAPSTTAE